jgi:hypothetical protein
METSSLLKRTTGKALAIFREVLSGGFFQGEMPLGVRCFALHIWRTAIGKGLANWHAMYERRINE